MHACEQFSGSVFLGIACQGRGIDARRWQKTELSRDTGNFKLHLNNIFKSICFIYVNNFLFCMQGKQMCGEINLKVHKASSKKLFQGADFCQAAEMIKLRKQRIV